MRKKQFFSLTNINTITKLKKTFLLKVLILKMAQKLCHSCLGLDKSLLDKLSSFDTEKTVLNKQYII